MVVALGAFNGNAQYSLAECFGFIQQIFNPVFFGYYTTFFRVFMVAEKAGCQYLFIAGIGLHITGHLPGNKFIVRKICVKRMYYPIAPGPLCTYVIILVAVAVCVPGHIH